MRHPTQICVPCFAYPALLTMLLFTFLFIYFISWLSVAAVLSVEFARTISMALSIADFVNKPCKWTCHAKWTFQVKS